MAQAGSRDAGGARPARVDVLFKDQYGDFGGIWTMRRSP